MPFNLSDEELLACVVGAPKGNAGPKRLLTRLSHLSELGDARTVEPLLIADLGARRGRRLLAALELGRRCFVERPVPETFDSHLDVLDWARARLVHLEHEELWLLCLDGRNRLKRAERVAQGGLLGCSVAPRDVLRPAVRNAAAAIVVVHNHPSGDPTPSPEDIYMTERLADACHVLGIPLLDHVVVARGGARSVAALGVLDAA